MSAPWILLAAIVAVAVVYVLLPVAVEAFLRFRARRRLTCPETGMNAEVGVDARVAGFTAAFRHSVLRVKSCSLWPKRAGCGRACLANFDERKPEALRPSVF